MPWKADSVGSSKAGLGAFFASQAPPLQELALRRPESYNYCGVEIFAPLVVAANEWAASPPAEWAADGRGL